MKDFSIAVKKNSIQVVQKMPQWCKEAIAMIRLQILIACNNRPIFVLSFHRDWNSFLINRTLTSQPVKHKKWIQYAVHIYYSWIMMKRKVEVCCKCPMSGCFAMEILMPMCWTRGVSRHCECIRW